MGTLFKKGEISSSSREKRYTQWFYNLLLILIVWPLLGAICFYSSIFVGEKDFQLLWIGRFSVFSSLLLFFSFLFIRKSNKDLSHLYCRALIWGLILCGGIQCVWGIFQLYGLCPSQHKIFLLTGSFYNPGPYSGYLAMVFPICLFEGLTGRKAPHYSYKRWLSKISIGVGLLILCILPAGRSRTAWLALSLSSFFVCFSYFSWGKVLCLWHRKYKKTFWRLGIITLFIFILFGYALYKLKPDSAHGRLFIWKMSVLTISKHPFVGYGHAGFARAFGETQENYFAKNTFSNEERIAGIPKNAFNEYLQVAIEYGIPVLIVVLAILVSVLIKSYKAKRIGIVGAMLSFLIFSFASYPMQIPSFALTFLLIVMSALLFHRNTFIAFSLFLLGLGLYCTKESRFSSFDEWQAGQFAYNAAAYVQAESYYEKLFPTLNNKADFLFQYGRCLYKLRKYTLSLKVLKEAMNYSSDPMIMNVLAQNYESMGKYKMAEMFFIRSIHRLPNRIYPYYLLAKLYARKEFKQPEKLKKVAQIVLKKKPKVASVAIEQMREEVRRLVK